MVFVEMEVPTRMARELGDAYAALLAEYNRIVVGAVSEPGGFCFGRAGDAQFAWFRDSLAAISSCTEVHGRLAAHAFPTGGEVGARIGIHYGPVTGQDEELVGLTLHETVPVAAVAARGQVAVSESAMPGDRSSGLRFVDFGEQDLRIWIVPCGSSSSTTPGEPRNTPADLPPDCQPTAVIGAMTAGRGPVR